MSPSILVPCPKCGAQAGDPCRSTKHRHGPRPAMRQLHKLRVGALRRCVCGNEMGTRERRCFECTSRRMCESHARTHATPEARRKRRAHRAVHQAIERGELEPPDRCEHCHKPCRPDAHHHRGYGPSVRLAVQFLCRRCHRGAHSREGLPRRERAA